MFLKDAETTHKAMQAMQAEGVPAGGIYDKQVRDWHICAYWEHILEKKSVAADGLPWSAVAESELPRYSREMCPRTLDLLSRAIMIDIHWEYSEEDCDRIALGINRAVSALRTADASAMSWPATAKAETLQEGNGNADD